LLFLFVIFLIRRYISFLGKNKRAVSSVSGEMMRPLRILFSRGSQKLKLDIRRCDFHHQFHSLVFHLDGLHFNQRRLKITQFSVWQHRNLTTNNIRRGVSNGSTENFLPDFDGPLQKLRKNMEEEKYFDWHNLQKLSETVRMSKIPLSENQNQELISILKEWNKTKHSEKEYARILKVMANVNFSVFVTDQNEIILAIMDQCLQNKLQSFRAFAVILSGIRGLRYSGSLLKSNHRQRILESLSDLNEDSNEKSYIELLSGIFTLGINWKEISDFGKRNLLSQLEALQTKLNADIISQVIYIFGKLGVNLKETGHKNTIIGLVRKTLKEIENDNGKLEVSRVVRFYNEKTSETILFEY
jgi:hypothetical protein